jgi:hypothetical protein
MISSPRDIDENVSVPAAGEPHGGRTARTIAKRLRWVCQAFSIRHVAAMTNSHPETFRRSLMGRSEPPSWLRMTLAALSLAAALSVQAAYS